MPPDETRNRPLPIKITKNPLKKTKTHRGHPNSTIRSRGRQLATMTTRTPLNLHNSTSTQQDTEYSQSNSARTDNRHLPRSNHHSAPLHQQTSNKMILVHRSLTILKHYNTTTIHTSLSEMKSKQRRPVRASPQERSRSIESGGSKSRRTWNENKSVKLKREDSSESRMPPGVRNP